MTLFDAACGSLHVKASIIALCSRYSRLRLVCSSSGWRNIYSYNIQSGNEFEAISYNLLNNGLPAVFTIPVWISLFNWHKVDISSRESKFAVCSTIFDKI